MTAIAFTVPGVPSTDHRPRVGRTSTGKVRTYQAPEFEQWKERVAFVGRGARPKGWRLDLQYVVEVVGYMPAARIDADNLRGAPDALQGILWKNDRQCRPVLYDYKIDKERPRVEIAIVAFDPKREWARVTVEVGRVA